jgi:hypothetical protein
VAHASPKKIKPLIHFQMVCSALAAVFLFLGLSAIHSSSASQADFVRFSKPDLLTFDELVELEKNDTPSAALAAKLEHLLTTPFLSNEAYLDGAKPKRPSSPELGPFLRAVCWNIERGIHFDPIRIALSEPEKFDQLLAEKKDPKAKPLGPDQLKIVKQQLDILQPTDLLILNEVDYGVTRTDYRDVARDLAKALNMNYAYGVEFLELDPLNLGLEKVEMEDKQAQADIQKSFDVDKSRYLGLHGTAVLSRSPFARPHCGRCRFAMTGTAMKKRRFPSWNPGAVLEPIWHSWKELPARSAAVAARSYSSNSPCPNLLQAPLPLSRRTLRTSVSPTAASNRRCRSWTGYAAITILLSLGAT